MFEKLNRLSLNTKLIFIQGLVIIILLSVFSFMSIRVIKNQFNFKSMSELNNSNQLIVSMIDAFRSNLEEQAGRMGLMFRSNFAEDFRLDLNRTITIGEFQTPSLYNGTTLLNLNESIVDRFIQIQQGGSII